MRRRDILCGLPAAALYSSLLHAQPVFAGGVTLAIVVNQTSKQKDISMSELRAIFKGGSVNGADGALVPFNLALNSAPRVAFDEWVLGMSPDEVSAYWIDRKIRGQRGAPKAIPSTDVLKAVLVKVPSSISYLPVSETQGPIRVLTVDGKKPGQGGYPLA